MFIFICGKAGSGKSTCANYLQKKYKFKLIKFADPIYNCKNFIVKEFGLPENKYRDLMIYIGKFARKTAIENNIKDPILNILNEKLVDNSFGQNIVVDDLRLLQEAEYVRNLKHDCIIIKIAGREMEKFDGSNVNDITETSFDSFKHDYTLNNFSGLDDLYNQMDVILFSISCNSKITKRINNKK